MAYNTPLTSLNITTSPNFFVHPTGNDLVPTLASANIQANAASATNREFLLTVGLTSAIGAGGNGDKVAFYAGMVGHVGTANIWAINTVTEMGASSGTYVAQGYELDFNNNNVNVGPNNFGAPAGYGLSISGAGAFVSTAAMLVSGPSAPIWYRGIVFTNFCISDKTIEDQTHSTTVFLVEGVHTYGMDFANGATQTPLRLGQGQYIKGRNAADTNDQQLLSLSGNNIVFGDLTVDGIFARSGFYPDVNSSFNLGQPANQWETVYCVTLVQSSDEDKKTDIAPLSPMSDVVQKLDPVSFKWRHGGADAVESVERQTVQDVELEEVEHEFIETLNGRPTLSKKTVIKERPAFDWVPVYDRNGAQVFDLIPAKEAVVDRWGSMVTPGQPEQRRARLHKVPRMIERDVTVTKNIPRAGKRDHFGFLAQDIKAAMDSLGIDCGIYVEGPEGTKHIRPDQLVPILWKATQEQMAANKALMQRVIALEQAVQV